MRTYPNPGGGLARALRLLGAVVWTLVSVSLARAQERRYLFEVGAAGAYNSFGDSTQLKSAVGGLARIGVWLPLNFSVEVEGSTTSPKSKTTGAKVGVKTISGSLLYNLLLGSKQSAYAKVGVGKARYGKDPCVGRTICGSNNPLIVGVGFRVGLTPLLFLRGEGMANFNKTVSDTGAAADTGHVTVKFSNYGASLGLSFMLGSKPIPDSDRDGVQNNRDRCPDTPAGAQVDGTGCPSDSDNDGVVNGIDRCPNTALGATVDASGCTRDSDGDNIADGVDKCPDTPPGALVDPTGCPKDSDGDSIADGLDRCSDTPQGATVDALGCPGDEDGDGVLDGLDRCPRTASGATVNAFGCVVGQSGRQPPSIAPTDSSAAPKRTPQARVPAPATGAPMVLRGVTFESGSARMQSGSYVELDSIAKVLIDNPNLRVEIGGHTDDAGLPADNQRLSTLRAEAVRNYLVAKGVPFQQLVARGYGATVPLTPDTTPRGRAANRRVEIRPLAPGS